VLFKEEVMLRFKIAAVGGAALVCAACGGFGTDEGTSEATATQPTKSDLTSGDVTAVTTPDSATTSLAESHRFLAYVLSEYDNAINVVDTGTNAVIFTVTVPGSLNRPHRGWVHPSQKRLYVSNKAGGKLLAFDISDPRVAPTVVNEVTLGVADLHNVQITGATNRAVDGTVWVSYAGNTTDPSFVGAYRASDLTLITKVFTGMTSAHGMLMRPGTDELWVTNRPSMPFGNIIRINTITQQPITTPTMNLPTLGQVEDQPNNVAFNGDAGTAYVVNQGDDANINVPTTVTLVDANTFSVKQQLQLDPLLGRRPHALTYDAARKWMWICTRLGGVVAIIDTVSQPQPRVVTHIPVGTECHDIALTPDGRFAYTSSMGGPGIGAQAGQPWYEDNVKVIDTSTLQVIKTIPIPSHAIVMRKL
jgi:DNA-binding beta-propeller fold protein YncE